MAIKQSVQISSADRHIGCPASLNWADSFTDMFSQAATTGTNLHKVLEDHIKNKKRAIQRRVTHTGDAKKIIDLVDNYLIGTLGLNYGIVESERAFLVPHPLAAKTPKGRIKGIVDLYALHENELHVADLKTGRMKISPDCLQLKIYGYLVGLHFKFEDPQLINLHIIQPGNIGAAKYTFAQLRDCYNTWIAALTAAAESRVKAVLGAHCRWCPHALECNPFAKATSKMSIAEMDDHMTNVGIFNTRRLALLDHKSVKQGKPTPGFVIEQKLGTPEWKSPAAIKAFEEKHTVTVNGQKPLSVTEACKAAGIKAKTDALDYIKVKTKPVVKRSNVGDQFSPAEGEFHE